jgi:pentapeptide MXKDX repeat protein
MAKYGQAQVDKPKTRNDVYTGLLAVSLVGMLIGCTLLYLDYRQYEGIRPPRVDVGKPLAADKAPPKVVEPPPKADAGKKEEPKKEEMKKDEMKKDEMKKDDAKKDAPKKDEKKDDAKKE